MTENIAPQHVALVRKENYLHTEKKSEIPGKLLIFS